MPMVCVDIKILNGHSVHTAWAILLILYFRVLLGPLMTESADNGFTLFLFSRVNSGTRFPTAFSLFVSFY